MAKARNCGFKIKEHDVQKDVVRLLKIAGCVLIGADVMDGLKFFSNADNRRYSFISHHKEMGYTKGQPDLVFVYRCRTWFLEMKKPDGRQSDEQKEFQQQIESQGQTYLVWRSVDDCVKFLNEQRTK